MSLYVSIEIVKICQVYFIHQDKDLYDEETDSRLQCRALNITEDLGQIQYIFSDKTGTLTENKMVFRRCTVSGIEYSHDANGKVTLFWRTIIVPWPKNLGYHPYGLLAVLYTVHFSALRILGISSSTKHFCM